MGGTLHREAEAVSRAEIKETEEPGERKGKSWGRRPVTPNCARLRQIVFRPQWQMPGGLRASTAPPSPP